MLRVFTLPQNFSTPETVACCAPASEVHFPYTPMFFMTGIENGQRW